MTTLGIVLVRLVDFYSIIIVIYVLMSWLPMTPDGLISSIYRFLGKICDPYLNLFKKMVPPIGGMIDISPIIALLVLQFATRLIVNFLL